jgi:4-amino-4-deoxy-L-arabinose transferase-like glycosyltransferase
MRRIAVVLGLCALLLPMAAWADGIDLTNQFGTVNVTKAGVVSNGAELLSYNGIVAPHGGSLGSVSFSTGAFLGASIFGDGIFSSAGSSFVVKGVGSHGQPKGFIFKGAFVGPITWTLVSQIGKFTYNFTLSGTISGTSDGRNVTGTTTQYITLSKNQWIHDQTGWLRLGNTKWPVPEPGTLELLGTGLIAVAGTMRRKLFAS